MWSNTHGPVHSLQPQHFLMSLKKWREDMVETRSSSPIFLEVKNNQLVFNGYGAQETSDMLCIAVIHPVMPAYYICKNDNLFAHFQNNVINYQQMRLEWCKSRYLPPVSSSHPLHFNSSAHRFFLQHIVCSRRARVSVDDKLLYQLHKRNLLNPNAVLQDSGDAIGGFSIHLYCCSILIILSVIPCDSPLPIAAPLRLRSGCSTGRLINYEIKFPSTLTGLESQTAYTYICAQPPNDGFSWPIYVCYST